MSKVAEIANGFTRNVAKDFRSSCRRQVSRAAYPIVASGGRRQAYDDFCTALQLGHHSAMSIVDSECSVTDPSPWAHLRQRDNWTIPDGANDDHCHLMIRCGESWLLADRNALIAFYGQGFRPDARPAVTNPVELAEKKDIFRALQHATHECRTKRPYSKAEHSFQLLARIDPKAAMEASPWASRFIYTLKAAMGC